MTDVPRVCEQVETGNSGFCCGHVILKAVCKLGQRQVGERAVWAMRIVVTPPGFEERLSVIERQELMDVQTFVAQASVERFDVAVVGGLPRPCEVELHAAEKRSRFDCL